MVGNLINMGRIINEWKNFGKNPPFDYCVIDNFLNEDFANKVAAEFPNFDSPNYNGTYDNAIELKKTGNIWDKFSENTYKLLYALNSYEVVDTFSKATQVPLDSDSGLHGGGQHIHPPGGKLNPHLDYNLHPKLGLQRKLNLLIYLTPDWKEEWGGEFGMWSSDENGQPTELHTKIPPMFNRAIIFDTTQNSWHGLASTVKCPEGKSRNSIAMYYMCETPSEDTNDRKRAVFVPTEEQKDNKEILELIQRRSQITSTDVEKWDRK